MFVKLCRAGEGCGGAVVEGGVVLPIDMWLVFVWGKLTLFPHLPFGYCVDWILCTF